MALADCRVDPVDPCEGVRADRARCVNDAIDLTKESATAFQDAAKRSFICHVDTENENFRAQALDGLHPADSTTCEVMIAVIQQPIRPVPPRG